MSNYGKEQIRDDDQVQHTHVQSTPVEKNQQHQTYQTHQEQNKQSHHQTHEHHEYPSQNNEQSHEQQQEFSPPTIKTVVSEGKKDIIDHLGISKYANFSLDVEDDQNNEIYLRIVGNQSKGSTFSKYTTYIIRGHDKNGQIDVSRRYSEFYALRSAMVQRWPGCFIPSIPTKNFMHKNDKDQTVKRERYLNDFVIKMTKLPYLYNSQQFQTFLRSKEVDTSNIYSSWSPPTNQAIINKYRDCFSDLAGKQIDSGTDNIIGQFYSRIKKNATLLQKYRVYAKSLALSRDTFNQHYSVMFSKILPIFERNIFIQFANGKQNQLVYGNAQQAKLNEHANIINQSTLKNPFWALYDMIKHQQRDGRAFIEALDARENLQNKRNSIQNRIKENQRSIVELMEGKTNIKSLTAKGTKQEVKYKLQVENQELKKQKNLLLVLSDIISALIVYIEIPAYQFSKINFYNKTLKKIGGYELNVIQIQADVWKDITNASSKMVQVSKGL